MKNLLKLVVAAMLLSLVSALMVAPAAAQEDEGEGGIVVVSTFGAGPDTFSPVYCTGTDCADMVGYMFIGLLAIDPATQNWAAGVPGALAESYELQEDGVTFIVNLRTDLTWSDGTPITIDDVLYFWDIVTTPEANYPRPELSEIEVESVSAIDDTTLEIVMQRPTCGQETTLASFTPVPSHIFEQFEFSELVDLEWNLAPDVTSGPFLFGEFRSNEFTVLRGWDGYADAELGYVNPAGLIQRVYADQVVLMEDFMSENGQINLMESPSPDRQQELLDRGSDGTGEYQTFVFDGNTWDYMGYNLADPTNPQPGVDEDGNPIDQGIHPIFGDKLVRQAFAHAVDIDAVIQGAVFGRGNRMITHILPGTPYHNDALEPRAYDPELALEILAEAGWVPEDAGSPAGPDNLLVCQDCLYAREVDAEYNGTPLEFELVTNAGNTRRESIAIVIQDELAQIGVTVNTNFIEFNTLIEDVFGGQTFDTYILGWRNGYPYTPDQLDLFGPQVDSPAQQGFNTTSFYNAEYVELEEQGLNPELTNACDFEARKAVYDRIQEIFYDEQPYMFLFAQNGLYAARSTVQGFDPFPYLIDWNIDVWSVISE